MNQFEEDIICPTCGEDMYLPKGEVTPVCNFCRTEDNESLDDQPEEIEEEATY